MDIKSLNKEELKELMKGMGQPAFRADQIYRWLHVELVRDYDSMTNISKELRNRLKNEYPLTVLKKARMQESAIDGTRKYLFELPDGNYVESVFMRYKHGNSVCISSQVGCRMGCRFCASTLDGLERNLEPSEMLDQIYAITVDTGERISNVVVMGTGEPMDNLDNLLKFIKLLTDENGLNISGRNITVSTCGIVPGILELAKHKLTLTLALSLHATTDEKRRKLMPIANKYSIQELMDACRYYYEETGRRITFEYSLVGGVNDTEEDAVQLSHLAGRLGSHVNLIPVNPIKERDYTRGNDESIRAFKDRLEKNGINVTVRRTLGGDIDASCGQLRRKAMEEKKSV
ncbi:MAG: 23S rRNA (adenine(2503)-C(2))-methyltransferase RlmN [Lachnospiraceae bacterium]|nr:23S rRNA (adenine(2503)-C(2))-methyltransferase RlmN [Lachnospiraceae bacterium]